MKKVLFGVAFLVTIMMVFAFNVNKDVPHMWTDSNTGDVYRAYNLEFTLDDDLVGYYTREGEEGIEHPIQIIPATDDSDWQMIDLTNGEDLLAKLVYVFNFTCGCCQSEFSDFWYEYTGIECISCGCGGTITNCWYGGYHSCTCGGCCLVTQVVIED